MVIIFHTKQQSIVICKSSTNIMGKMPFIVIWLICRTQKNFQTSRCHPICFITRHSMLVWGQRASILYPNLRCGSERITLSDTVCWGHGRIQPVCVPCYNDVIMGSMASQITIVYSAVYLGADQRKHQSSASLVFVHRWPVTREMFPFNDVIMRLVFDIVSIHSSAISRKIYWQNCHL